MPTDRQAHALAHPLGRADLHLSALAALKADERQPDGNLLRSILAIDR